MTSDYGADLLPQHRDVLTARAVSPDIAATRGYSSTDSKTELRRLGFTSSQQEVPALVIPVWSPRRERVCSVLRPDDPRLREGSPVKYDWPYRAPLRLDVPPSTNRASRDASIPLWITEGILKGDALAAAGAGCVVAVQGTYGWRNKQGALADWEDLALKGRSVFVCFDSDCQSNDHVYGALARLVRWLETRGANPTVVYLPNGDDRKTGADDFLAAGHNLADLEGLASPLRDFMGPSASAQVHTPSVEPPSWAADQGILQRFGDAVRLRGVVGEIATAQLLYLVITSRLLDKPVSAGIKGQSSSGKSYVTEAVLDFFGSDAVIKFTGMSQRALVFSKEDYAHKTIVVFELTALREGVEDDLTSYFVRTLLSEGRIEYEVTVRSEDGFTTKKITKEGPTNLIFTTTQTRVHSENETRVLSLHTDDTKEQTQRILRELATEGNGAAVDLEDWQRLQSWLQHHGVNRVTIPYAMELVEQIPPVDVRLRRDVGAVLGLVRAHAILEQRSRQLDPVGRIVATVDDYAEVHRLVAAIIAEGVGRTVSDAVRETVEVLADAPNEGMTVRQVAEKLDLARSSATRRMRRAADEGYAINLEEKRGRPGRWVTGAPLPDDLDVLPHPRNLCATTETSADQEEPEGCAGVHALTDPYIDEAEAVLRDAGFTFSAVASQLATGDEERRPCCLSPHNWPHNPGCDHDDESWSCPDCGAIHTPGMTPCLEVPF